MRAKLGDYVNQTMHLKHLAHSKCRTNDTDYSLSLRPGVVSTLEVTNFCFFVESMDACHPVWPDGQARARPVKIKYNVHSPRSTCRESPGKSLLCKSKILMLSSLRMSNKLLSKYLR